MAKNFNSKPRRKRSTKPLNDLPGLFDNIDIDFTAAEVGSGSKKIPASHVPQPSSEQSLSLDPKNIVKPSSLRYISFGSGSSGNCAYLGITNGDGSSKGVLIDAGVEPDKVYQALQDNKIDIGSISGILLTHDHGDHVSYAYNILRKNQRMVIYATMRTMTGLLRRHSISRRIKDYHKIIYREHPFEAGGFIVTAFETSHDGTENVGFAINTPDNQHKFAIATDTGIITERADFYMRQANYIVIESNYDLHMLMTGRYPEYLKGRIIGPRGHLDNTEAARYIQSIAEPHLSNVFLCHLSEENNTPQIAWECMYSALTQKGLVVGDATNPLMANTTDIALAVLPRREVSHQFILRRK